jgi:hypothetical protein
MYFLNTDEAGTHRRQRLRRTPLFTADPDTTLGAASIGAGAHDIRAFSGDGVRLEPLANVLVAYFEDGVAFIRETGVQSAPDNIQVVTKERGLLGTHAMCNVSNNEHFGIFSDGWFRLDASGRFKEVGLIDMGGIPTHKWKRTFYENLDFENRHRLYCHYDQFLNAVMVSVPVVGQTDNTQVWYYFLDTDRVFVMNYPATCFGSFERQIADAVLWTDWIASGVLWSALIGSWGSLQARFGFKDTGHGTATGNVLQHNRDLITQAGAAPTWSYGSPVGDMGWARFLKTADQLTVEHINVANTAATFEVVDGTSGGESAGVVMDIGNAGDIDVVSRHFRHTAKHLGFQVSGSGPVLIRSFRYDYWLDGTEEISAES